MCWYAIVEGRNLSYKNGSGERLNMLKIKLFQKSATMSAKEFEESVNKWLSDNAGRIEVVSQSLAATEVTIAEGSADKRRPAHKGVAGGLSIMYKTI